MPCIFKQSCLQWHWRRASDTMQEEEGSRGELSHLPNIATAPIPEVEAVLRTADHWHFDAFRLVEASQGYPLSTLGFWLMQQNRVAKEFSECSLLSFSCCSVFFCTVFFLHCFPSALVSFCTVFFLHC